MVSLATIDALHERFAIDGLAALTPGQGNLPKIEITAPGGSADIYLHGAQVTSWRPTGHDEVLFLSAQSRWEDGKAIRGGIPVCFPWFRGQAGNAQAPAHGFVRTKTWELLSIERQQESAVVSLATESDHASKRWWPYDCRVQLRITAGAELKLELTVTNTGSESFDFEEALHTYHRVHDVKEVSIRGLAGVAYLDNMDANAEKQQVDNLRLTQPTDNAYMNTASAVEVIDPSLRRRIRTEKKNSLTTIAWNPWQEGAKALADLGDLEWQTMVCAEAGNILSNAVTLDAGQEHTLSATITVTKD